ncbi:MAG: hypothetical protein ACI8Z1_001602, partial [Candidatus Azotimanducaceae bacterium]
MNCPPPTPFFILNTDNANRFKEYNYHCQGGCPVKNHAGSADKAPVYIDISAEVNIELGIGDIWVLNRPLI